MSDAGQRLLGGIEAGGTKFVLALGTSPTDIIARQEIPTLDPASTLANASQWFEEVGRPAAIGIGSFGPVELDRSSPRWGHITNTPKPGWADCDIVGHFAAHFGVPIGFDTDVTAAALAEYTLGAGRGAGSLAYVTVGTGIGGGLMIDGSPVHGAAHPEMGHIFPRLHPQDRAFGGVCPHHGDCLEGLAGGPAIKARWGVPLSQLPTDHEAHAIIADYLAQLAQALIAISAVEIIVFGGGVMKTEGLLDRVKQRVPDLCGGYFPGEAKRAIHAPALGDNAGLTGALLLAAAAS
jgi:fructokinase